MFGDHHKLPPEVIHTNVFVQIVLLHPPCIVELSFVSLLEEHVLVQLGIIILVFIAWQRSKNSVPLFVRGPALS